MLTDKTARQGAPAARAGFLRPHAAGRTPVRARLLRRGRQAGATARRPCRQTSAARRPRAPPEEAGRIIHHPSGPLHVAESPVSVDGQRLGDLLIVHDMSFVERRSADTKKYVVYLFAAHRRGDRPDHRRHRGVVVPRLDGRHQGADPRAVARALARSPRRANCGRSRATWRRWCANSKASAACATSRRSAGRRKTCARILREDLKGDEILIVSNREPYIHVHRDGRDRGAAPGQRPGHGDGARACAPARAPGSRTARAAPTARRVDAAGPRHGAAREARLPHPPRLAQQGGGGRVLLRLRQRGAVASVPHRAHPAGVPRLRLGTLPRRQPALRRGRGAGIAHRESDRSGAGLSLRAAAAHDPRTPAAGDDHHLLAHPLAESGGVRHLPLARRAARGPAGLVHPRVPHPVPLQQLLRHRGPLRWRRASIARRPASTTAATPPRCAAIRSRSSGRPQPLAAQPPVPECRAGGAHRRSAWRPRCSSASASTAWTTPRASSSASPPSSACSSSSRSWIGTLRLRADRRALALAASRNIRACEPGCARPATRINDRFGSAGLPADRAQDRAPRRRPGLHLLPRRRPVLRVAACTTA